MMAAIYIEVPRESNSFVILLKDAAFPEAQAMMPVLVSREGVARCAGRWFDMPDINEDATPH